MRFATSSSDGVVRVWASDDLALLAELRTDGPTLRTVMFTPTGDRLIACDKYGKVYVWQAEPDMRTPTAIEADVTARSVWQRQGRELVPK